MTDSKRVCFLWPAWGRCARPSDGDVGLCTSSARGVFLKGRVIPLLLELCQCGIMANSVKGVRSHGIPNSLSVSRQHLRQSWVTMVCLMLLMFTMILCENLVLYVSHGRQNSILIWHPVRKAGSVDAELLQNFTWYFSIFPYDSRHSPACRDSPQC